MFPDDHELTLVSELLQLSHDALARSPGQLGVQIKARMEKPQVRQQLTNVLAMLVSKYTQLTLPMPRTHICICW